MRAKARIIEGKADDEIEFDISQLEQKYEKDSLLGNEIGMAFAEQEILKLEALLSAAQEIETSKLSMSELYHRMIYNEIYDEINMGSSVYSTPVGANDSLFISTKDKLFSIGK